MAILNQIKKRKDGPVADQLFDIIFKGETLAGIEVIGAQVNLAKLFKQPSDKIAKQFFSHPCYIKKSLDRETAAKYQAALKQAGLKTYIKEQQAAPVKTAIVTAASTPAINNEKSLAEEETYGFSLAPMEGPLLKPSERKPSFTSELDLSAYSMATQEGYLVDPQELPPKEYPLIEIPNLYLVPMGK
jgi:hypothetical protein